MDDMGPRVTADADASRSLDVAFNQWNALLEALPIGVFVCDREGRIVRHNRRAVEFWGRLPDPSLGRASILVYQPDGPKVDVAASRLNEVLASGIAARDIEAVVERPDGSRIDILANIEPLRDEAGDVIGAVTCFQDVTELKRARQRADRVDGWIRRVVEHSPVAIYWTDADGRIVAFNAAAARLWGRTPVLGKEQWCGSHRLFHPDGRPMPLDASPTAMALKTGEARQGQEAIYERPDGVRGAFLAYPTPLRDHDGILMGAVNMLVDISERKEAEEHQKVLVDELNHRVKNTLAAVQSLAAHSLRGGIEPRRMRERFEARLVALSNAHNQLAVRRWQDADLRALAEDVLAPYRADHAVVLEGESVTVPARTAVSLSLVLHELATNAVKYGALSVPAGRLSVHWRLSGAGRLVLEWREIDGPPVESPIHKGFGTRFIAGAISGELGGSVEHGFARTGVTCRIEAPL